VRTGFRSPGIPRSPVAFEKDRPLATPGPRGVLSNGGEHHVRAERAQEPEHAVNIGAESLCANGDSSHAESLAEGKLLRDCARAQESSFWRTTLDQRNRLRERWDLKVDLAFPFPAANSIVMYGKLESARLGAA